MNIQTASIFNAQYADDPHPLQEFFVKFNCAIFDSMTDGREYLVTFNGADRGSYRGHDDEGDAFCFTAQVFDAPMSTMIIPIDPPAGNIDYTHMGNYKGPKGHRFTTGGNYNLIYECGTDSVSARNDVGVWQQVSGEYFDVTHDYSQGGGIPNKPTAHNTAHNPTASDILGNAAPTPPCGGNAAHPTPVDDMYTPEQEEEITLWTEDGDPCIPAGPASTEDLRQYRFKPDLF